MSPFARFNNLDADKQQRILDVALDEFITHGYEGASLNRIIQQSEMSKGSFYYYFEDKADLFVTILRQELSIDLWIERSHILDASTSPQFWSALAQMTREGIELLQTNPMLMRLGQILHALPPAVKQQGELAAFIQEIVARVAALLERGQQIGALRQDIPTGIMTQLWMSTDMILDQWAFHEWEHADEQRREWLVSLGLELFQRMFLPADQISLSRQARLA